MSRHASLLASLGILIAGALALGCAGSGPGMLRAGRPLYNEAIAETNNEQLLAMIVRMRYNEPAGLLAVNSVTANMRIRAGAGAQFGIGPDSNYAGNLVPLSAGAFYEDNPTITYTPVQGQEYLRQALSPLPLDITVLLMNSLGDAPGTFTLLLEEINGIQNPIYRTDDADTEAARFAEIVDLLALLHQRGILIWAATDDDAHSFVALLRAKNPEAVTRIARLYDLLSLHDPPALGESNYEHLTVRVSMGDPFGIDVRPRSLFSLFQIAAASVDVPEDHIESGIAPHIPPTGPASQTISIQRSATRPQTALVSVHHHGWWYSIDATDAQSKATFRLIEAVMTARIADASHNRNTPVLTVPVSR